MSEERRILIAIAGNIKVGKSSVTDHMIAEYDFKEDAFARVLKIIGIACGFHHDEMYGTQEQKLQINPHFGVSGRQFLQIVGSELFRDMLPTLLPGLKDKLGNCKFWSHVWQINYQASNQKNVVVSDCRFPDEAAAIRKNGGIIIKIHRPSLSREGAEYQHQSESHIDNLYYDVKLINDGTKEKLLQNIDLIMHLIRTGEIKQQHDGNHIIVGDTVTYIKDNVVPPDTANTMNTSDAL